MSTATIFALVVVGAVIAWKLGSLALRLLGGFLVFGGIIEVFLPATQDSFTSLQLIAIIVVGLSMWLAGHWFFAFRHHAYRSGLAQRFFLGALGGRLDPTRRWIVQ